MNNITGLKLLVTPVTPVMLLVIIHNPLSYIASRNCWLEYNSSPGLS